MMDVEARLAAPKSQQRRSARRKPELAGRLNPLRFFRDDLLRNGHLLTLSTTATCVISALYWAGATRSYGAEDVGRFYAAVSVLTFIAGIGQLNLNNVLIRFVPAAGGRLRRLVLGCYAAATLTTLAVA